jgi:hypothetical protein
MTTKKASKQTAHVEAVNSSADKPVALTLKIDGQTYIRLSMLRAKARRTAQDILVDALKAYLDREGA